MFIGLVSTVIRRRVLIVLTMVIVICGIGGILVYNHVRYTPYIPAQKAKIMLYGEAFDKKEQYNEEYKIWKDHYEKDHMRYLFMEVPYYTGQYLNIWMKADDDEIVNTLCEDMRNSDYLVAELKQFLINVKQNCPETIFCGTDVGQQYETTGKRYLTYLEGQAKKDTEEYNLTVMNINQGKMYEDTANEVYRESAMTENFMRIYDKCKQETVMGIYGDAHCDPREMNATKEIECMARQLKEAYGDIIEYHFMKER